MSLKLWIIPLCFVVHIHKAFMFFFNQLGVMDADGIQKGVYIRGIERHKVSAVFKGDIYVTENGIATDDDEQRIAFIQRAIWGVKRCIADSIPVKGYFYWSFIDNYEWQNAYSMKFGLVAADRTTQERKPKPSLRFLGGMIRENRVTEI